MSSRCIVPALVCLVTVGCAASSTDDPVGTAETFVRAVRRGDCDAAWRLFSQATREHTEAHVRQARRNQAYAAQVFPTPQTLYCQGTYGNAWSGSARLVEAGVERAVVSLQFSSGTHFPIIPFLSSPYKEWRSSLTLVREGGAWRIDLPRTETGPRDVRVADVGDVEVRHHPGGDPTRDRLEAEGVVWASRDALEAILSDPHRWPAFMPLLREVEPLGEVAPDRRSTWRLIFQDRQGVSASTVVAITPYGRLRRPDLPWSTITWNVEDHPDRGSAPDRPLFTGSIELRPRFEGTWATFGLVIQPDEWPAALPPQFLSDALAAAAVTGLDREARASAAARR